MSFRSSRPLFSSLRSARAQHSSAWASPSRRYGLYFGAGATIASIAYIGTFSEDTSIIAAWKSRWLLHAEVASPASRSESHRKHSIRVDPETSIPFPSSLSTITSSNPLTLIGLGVRKVSFLRVKVYSVGFYIDGVVLDYLNTIEGWSGFNASRLLTPSGETGQSGEALMKNLLELPISCAVRIVPSRNTDFNHLRDGFTRAFTARQKLSKQTLSEQDDERISRSLQTFKSIFPTGMTVPKGNSLVLMRTSDKALVVEYDGKILGRVEDDWLSREMILAYFADKDVISPKLKEDVARGFEEYIK